MLPWADLLRPWSLNHTLVTTTTRTELRSQSLLAVMFPRCAIDVFSVFLCSTHSFLLFILSNDATTLGFSQWVPDTRMASAVSLLLRSIDLEAVAIYLRLYIMLSLSASCNAKVQSLTPLAEP
jgi:hypothetical protein